MASASRGSGWLNVGAMVFLTVMFVCLDYIVAGVFGMTPLVAVVLCCGVLSVVLVLVLFTLTRRWTIAAIVWAALLTCPLLIGSWHQHQGFAAASEHQLLQGPPRQTPDARLPADHFARACLFNPFDRISAELAADLYEAAGDTQAAQDHRDKVAKLFPFFTQDTTAKARPSGK